MDVSIPYRLATNPPSPAFTGQGFKFQFLIGWLQTTKTESVGKSFSKRFQFLIGWLQTLNNYTENIKKIKFQFLIGWLQTMLTKTEIKKLNKGFNSL